MKEEKDRMWDHTTDAVKYGHLVPGASPRMGTVLLIYQDAKHLEDRGI